MPPPDRSSSGEILPGMSGYNFSDLTLGKIRIERWERREKGIGPYSMAPGVMPEIRCFW